MRDPTERMRNVRMLAEGAESVPALLEAARDPSLQVSREALRRLVEIGGSETISQLRRRLLTVDPALVADYARALVALDDPRATEAALQGLSNPSSHTRLAAALALRELEDESSAEALRVATNDPQAAVRRAALDALARLTRSAENERAARGLLVDRDTGVRRAAVRTTARVAARASDALRPTLDDPSARVRVELAAVSEHLDDAATRTLLHDPDADVRARTVRTLIDRPRPSLAPALDPLLEDPSWRVRQAACRALAKAGRTEARSALVRTLLDPHPTVRATALLALRELFGGDLTDALAAELPAADPELRRALVYALGESGNEEALAAIAALASDDSAGVRLAVVHTLGRLLDRALVRQTVEELARDEDRGVAHAAWKALEA